MSDNGSGLFNIDSTGQPVVASTLITAATHNALTTDLATGLSNRICKDGQTTITANIPFNDKKITGLAAATLRTDAASLATIQDGTGVYVGTVAGTADVITLTASPAITAYVAGQTFRFIASGANTTTVTVAINGLAAKAITKNGTTALAAGDIAASSMVSITYDGTRFILTSTSTAILNSPTINTATISSPTFSGTASGTYTLAGTVSLTSPVITTGTVAADPVTALGIASKQYVDANFSTGDVKLTLKTVADTSWILMDDKTIGNAASSATGRANADTSALFTLLWTNIIDTWAPVSSGRGASAAADYAANKTIALPKTLGRALAGYGTGTVVASGVDADVDIGAANSLTVASNNTKWITGMAVVFTLASGTITGLSSSSTYYVIRSSSTLVQLATTLALAQAGTAIDLTAKSSPVWTITHTYTARVLGEAVGEQDHAMSSTELLAHTHSGSIRTSGGGDGFPGGTALFTSMSSTGGNVAMNITDPTTYLNVMVKL